MENCYKVFYSEEENWNEISILCVAFKFCLFLLGGSQNADIVYKFLTTQQKNEEAHY